MKQPQRSWDDMNAEAVLVTCVRCLRDWFMTHPQPVCIACRQAAK